jgi:hypothetical protein
MGETVVLVSCAVLLVVGVLMVIGAVNFLGKYDPNNWQDLDLL